MKRDRDDVIEGSGEVLAEFKGGFYTVKLSPPLGGQVLAKLCGRMQKARIRILPGDRVELEVSAYDTSRARIVYRGQRARHPSGDGNSR